MVLHEIQLLFQDPDTWSDDDFKSMKITLQHYLPSI